MKRIWHDLEIYLHGNTPTLLADLNPPASAAQTRQLEKQLDVTLPQDFVQCLMLHDGQQGKAAGLFEGYEFLSTRKISLEWAALRRLLDRGDLDEPLGIANPAVLHVWWDPRWIPFASNGAGDSLCLDLAPAAAGRSGQVISYSHEFPQRSVKAPGFSAWLKAFANRSQA
ncbi:SMI1/KNR4 family protein [Pseudomonas viridiflava]|uniref:SMI1/KNR4 family protein n=1 Tax=Pseudomonas viridiflava TaxID=33069 RepID=UPI002EA8D82E|nr:SMI1/KNR4 family protein [Pseudomonas viridiflava]